MADNASRKDDLASAIVDLGIGAEKRRQARRALRDSADVVVAEILRHVRVGDWALILVSDIPGDRLARLYKIERVDWWVMPNHTDQPLPAEMSTATLVQYRLDSISLDDDDDWTALYPGERYEGAVLLDVRHSITYSNDDGMEYDTGSVWGSKIVRVQSADEEASYDADLHLATDSELLTFGNEAVAVVGKFTESFRSTGNRYAGVADTLAKLAPK